MTARSFSPIRWETPKPLNPWSLPAASLVLGSGAPRDAWLAARRPMVCGSDIAKLLNASPYQGADAFSLWLDKTGRIDPDEIDGVTDAMVRGQIFEDPVVDLWVARVADFPIEVRRHGLVRSRKHPRAGATVDRLSICPDGRCLVEVKTASNIRDWTGDSGDPEVPAHVQIQGQWQLGVTGRDHIHFIVLGPRLDAFDRRMERDDPLIDTLMTTVDDWWETYVEADVPPPASARSADLLRRVYGNPSKGSEHILTDDEAEMMRALPALQADLDAAKLAYDDTLAQLQARIGNATEIMWSPDPRDLAATWRPEARIDGCDKEFKKAHADLVRPFSKFEEVEVVDVKKLAENHPELIASGRLRYRRKWLVK